MGYKDLISHITEWFVAAVPNPTEDNKTLQLGIHFEEIGEMLFPLVPAMSTTNLAAEANLVRSSVAISKLALELKAGYYSLEGDKLDRVELLDALCDQIVTAVGVAHMLGMNIHGALEEVNTSNWSKFGDDFKPIFDSQGKIIKGVNYRKPTLDPFV